MPRTRSGLVHREPQEAPGPPIALNRMASAEIAGLEPSWVDPDAPAAQLEALSEEGQLQEATQAPVVHHFATCTDPACVGPISAAPDVQAHDTNVGLHFHTARSKATTDRISQERASPAALPHGLDLFQRLSPELRDMIFELVYVNSHVVAAVQGFCTCGPIWDEESDKSHAEGRTDSPILRRATRGTRSHWGCYIEPEEWTELTVDGQALSPINSLLFVNKQTYLEALPHLYRNVAFFFDDWRDTHKFITTVAHDSLKYIRTVEVFSDTALYSDAAGDMWPPYKRLDSESDYSRLFGCIVASMPNIERLEIGFWWGHFIKIKSYIGGALRCQRFELALLQFAALKRLRQIDVEVLEPLMSDPPGMPDVYHVNEESEETAEAVKMKIKSGDRRALDRAREASLRKEGYDLKNFGKIPGANINSGFSYEWWNGSYDDSDDSELTSED